MQKIRDLIEIPDVETVIQVSSVESLDQDELKKRIIDSFILTEDIIGTIAAVFHSLKRGNGCGIILKGNYGSGKSHLLAFLGSVLSFPAMLKGIKKTNPELAGFDELLAENKYLPVVITLTDFSGENGLSDIVTQKISAALQNRGLELPVDPDKIVRDFNRIILPNITDDFNSFLKEREIKNLTDLPSSRQSGAILDFLKLRNIPFRPFYDYREYFNGIDKILGDYKGIFLLIDELSEYLRARARGDLVSEDIRFIQFLGERIRRSDMCAAFSMQEAIEEAAEISADALNKIKDRFPIRINLTSVHLKELVQKRLLVKKQENIPYIKDIYHSLSSSFPEWFISEDDFVSIYPVHPAAFTMLEGITGIFSKTRGMVDFIYTEIKGRDTRGIRGLLEEESETLLLPDRIFDHFRNNIEESPEYYRLLKDIFSAFEREIPVIFSKDADRNTALRIIKIILLYQILPGGKKPTARELAHMILNARFKMDPSYNYTYIRDKLLRDLEKVGFLGIEKGSSPLEDRFFLLYKENPVSLLENKVRQFIAKNIRIEKQALWFFISNLNADDEKLPLAQFVSPGNSVSIRFENTVREGIVFLKGLDNIDKEDTELIAHSLNNGEPDFALIIGFPVQTDNEDNLFRNLYINIDSRFKDNIFFWKPALPSRPETDILVESYAKIKVIDEEKDRDGSLFSNMRADAFQKAIRTVRDLYSRSLVYSFENGDLRKNDLLSMPVFDRTVEFFAANSLKSAFPSHDRIKPDIEIRSNEVFRQIILLFRENGQVDFNFQSNKTLMNAVDALLKTSGLLKIIKKVYMISPDPSRNIFIKDLLRSVELQLPFGGLYLELRKSKYGIKKDIFSLYLFFLAYAGFISIEKSGRKISADRLDYETIQASDRIKTGEGLSPLFIEKHGLLGPFSAGLTSKNIHLQSQREVWETLVEFKYDNENSIRSSHEKINELESYPAFAGNPLNNLRNVYEKLIGFVSGIKVSKDSREGLDSLLQDTDPEFNLTYLLEIHGIFRKFLSDDADRLSFIYSYITNPNIYAEDESLKKEIMSLLDLYDGIENIIMNNNVGRITGKFGEFRERYKSAYLKAHREIHSNQPVAELENIRISPGFRILTALAGIETISVKDDLIRINSLIMNAKASVCRRPVTAELDIKPYCECRLKGGPKADIDELNNIIKSGISQYLAALKEKGNAEKMRNYLGALTSADEDSKRNMLKEIMELDTGQENILIRAITPESVRLVNKALSGNIRIIRKEFKELYNSLYGRKFRKQELLNIFNDWLKTETEKDEEIIYDIASLDDAAEAAAVPAMLLEEINKALDIDDEKTKLRAFALAKLLHGVSGGKHMPIIGRILFIDPEPGFMAKALDMGGKLQADSDLSGIFTADMLGELINLLELKNKTTAEILELFYNAGHLPAVRDAVLEAFIKGDAAFDTKTVKISEYTDDSAHSRLLVNLTELEKTTNNNLRHGRDSEKFNQEYYFSAFEMLFFLEKIQWLSLNNNILIDLIQEKYAGKKKDLIKECGEYFNAGVNKWEKQDELRLRLNDTATHWNSFQWNDPVVFIFDSLRTDLFIELNKILTEETLKLTGKRLFIVSCPSDTLTFRRDVFNDPEPANGKILKIGDIEWMYLNAADRDYRKEKLLEHMNESNAVIASFSFFDEKIHSTRQSLTDIGNELEIFCREKFIPLLKSIPKERTVCITADHGFTENKNYARDSRYTHGGGSFFERIIPFGLYKRL